MDDSIFVKKYEKRVRTRPQNHRNIRSFFIPSLPGQEHKNNNSIIFLRILIKNRKGFFMASERFIPAVVRKT